MPLERITFIQWITRGGGDGRVPLERITFIQWITRGGGRWKGALREDYFYSMDN